MKEFENLNTPIAGNSLTKEKKVKHNFWNAMVRSAI